MGLSLRLANCVTQPWPWCVSCCAGTDHTMQNSPQHDLVPDEISLWICPLRNLLDPALTLAEAGHWVYFFYASVRDSRAGKCQRLPVAVPGQHFWSYKVIHRFLAASAGPECA